MSNNFIQDLQLEVGERAICTAGCPHKCTIIVECKKDFSEAKDSGDIVDNPFDYISVVDRGRFGVLTSHFISANWEKISKNNKVKINKDGNYSLTGLSKSAKDSLLYQRSIVPSDEYIIALYDEDEDDIFFVNESSYSSAPRAIIINN